MSKDLIPSVPTIILYALTKHWEERIDALRDSEAKAIEEGLPFLEKAADLAATALEQCLEEVRLVSEIAEKEHGEIKEPKL